MEKKLIEKLTKVQGKKLAEHYKRFFGMATSTAPADRPRAEAAARRMAEIGGVKVGRVVWVASPDEGASACGRGWASLRDSLRDSLCDSLCDSLWDSLRDSLWASLRGSLCDSLWASLCDSLWDSGWLAFYAFPRDVLQVKYAPKDEERLRLHEEIGASAFALWIVPGAVILCERPAKCKVVDGRLVGIEWRMP